jgi:uncharacterized OB-fold protein
MVEFASVDTLFLSRLVGNQADDIQIGMPVQSRFLRKSRFKVTDVYFVLTTSQV